MSLEEVRREFFNFMKSKGHILIPSYPVVPADDATTLFVGSGMQPLLPYFLGEKHPNGTRIANSQRCIRTNDIEEVGDSTHTTFFEMLGNWSFGDYGKKEQIEGFFDFLVNNLKIPVDKLYVTVFIGDEKNGIPKDTESAEIWQKLFEKAGVTNGIQTIGSVKNGDENGIEDDARIFYYDSSKNWWSRAGEPNNMPIGELGGPDTEVFYRFNNKGKTSHPNSDTGEFIEIGNSVFMSYRKTDNGFEKLEKENIDFGGGLERIAAIKNNLDDIFEIDVFDKMRNEIENITNTKYNENKKAYRIIMDHLRASAFLIRDGVIPSNTDRGYILRRLLRRGVFNFYLLNNKSFEGFLSILEPLFVVYKYEFIEDRENIKNIIKEEEEKFSKTLTSGMKELDKLIKNRAITGKDSFVLFSTYGFPIEMTTEIAKQNGIDVNIQEFEEQLKDHKEKSKTSSEAMFKGGLGDTGEESVRYHTATHLLHQALRDVLGDHVVQKGSNINKDRLRFDFSHDNKLTKEEIKSVEDIVNKNIKDGLEVTYEDMTLEEARKLGAIGIFDDKYSDDSVRVYSIGEYSKEFCGGPHVKNTSEIGGLEIIKEESVASGIRRIKARFV